MLLSKKKKVTLLPIPENMWICYIHGQISSYCVNNKIAVSINMIEKALFLTQYESIINENEPFYEYETYIYNNEIRIKYLSDRLRVMSMEIATAESTSGGYLNFELMDKYMQSIKKNLNTSELELSLIVEKIIKQKKLNEKYFKFEKYNNSFLRKRARVSARTLDVNFMLFMLKRFLGFIGYSCVLLYIVSVIQLVVDSKFPPTIESLGFALLLSPFLILWMIWERKWMKPTKFELENNYFNE